MKQESWTSNVTQRRQRLDSFYIDLHATHNPSSTVSSEVRSSTMQKTTTISTHLSRRKISLWRNFQPEGTTTLSSPKRTPQSILRTANISSKKSQSPHQLYLWSSRPSTTRQLEGTLGYMVDRRRKKNQWKTEHRCMQCTCVLMHMCKKKKKIHKNWTHQMCYFSWHQSGHQYCSPKKQLPDFNKISCTRNQFDMYSFVSQSWCAFWQKNDMLLKWFILKSTPEPKPQMKAYHLKDTALLCVF